MTGDGGWPGGRRGFGGALAGLALVVALAVGCGGSEGVPGRADAGIVAPVVIDPGSYTFADTLVNKSSETHIFSIRNTATATLSTLIVTLGGAAANQFTLENRTCLGPLGRNAACLVGITFQPSGAGEKKATLEINAGGGRKAINLLGKGVNPARVTVAPMDGGFGSVMVGATSEARAFVIKNDGDLEATGLDIRLTGEMFAASTGTCGAVLAGGQSCMQPVVFAPTSVGVKLGTLVAMAGGAGAQPVTIQLTGTGVARPAVTTLPGAVDFAPVGVGRTGAATTLTVRNPGSAAVTGLVAGVSSPDFVLGAGTCEGPIPPAGTCTLEVRFAPRSVGAKRGELVLSVTGGESVGVPLSGTGVRAAALLISPPAPNFGSIPALGRSSPLALTVRNDGQEEIEGLAVALSGADSAEFEANHSCGSTLLAGATCEVGVVFKPGNEGAATATLRVTGQVPGTGLAPPSVETTLSGTGVRQPSIAIDPTDKSFGTFALGQESPPTNFTITNTGGAATGTLRVTTVGSDFKIVPGTDGCNGLALAAGTSCVLSVVFSPSGAGPRNSPLTVVADPGGSISALLGATGVVGPRLELDRNSASFGTVGIGGSSSEVIFTVTNRGDTDSGLVQLVSGSSQFVIVSNGCQNQTLIAGEACSLSVRFEASATGDFNTELRASASPGGAVSALLTATGAMPASIAFQQAGGTNLSVLSFQGVAVGATSSAGGIQVFVRNTGQNPSGALSTALSGNHPGDFGVVPSSNSCGPALAPGGQCSLSLFFTPTAGGDRDATVTVTAAAGGVATLLLQGTGLLAQIAVDLPSHDFGPSTVGIAGSTQTFRVENGSGRPGSGGVQLDTSQATGDFAVTRNGCLLPDNVTPLPLAAGESCTFDVQFTPAAAGARAGAVKVLATPGGSVDVALTGTGVP